MKDIKKYQGVIPAFYACYDAEGNISVEGVKALTRHLIAKGVKGVYVGGSSGECIYQHVDERKTVLEAVMSEAKGKLTVIAHVGCNNTADSMELARHAESVGVDAIASIPPIYFHLPEYAIAKYWNDMSAEAPNTEFVIYNIPQLAGTALTMSLLNEMLKNPNVVAVKNSSMPTQDIQLFKDAGIQARGEDGFAVFNGPDEQFVSGLLAGAVRRYVTDRPALLRTALAFFPAAIVGSVLWQSMALALVYGGDAKQAFFLAKLVSRSIQFALTGTVDTLIVWLLLRRGALNAVQRRIQVKGGAEHDHQ